MGAPQLHRSKHDGDVEVVLEPELIIAGMVRDWVARALPNDRAAADVAAAYAVHAYTQGASVSEACEEARRLIGSWIRHPSHHRSEVALSPELPRPPSTSSLEHRRN